MGIPVFVCRWIEAEREEALLGSKATGSPEGAESNATRVVNHVEDAFFAFGSGPRVCPGQVKACVFSVCVVVGGKAGRGERGKGRCVSCSELASRDDFEDLHEGMIE